MAKLVQLSADNVNWFSMPATGAELTMAGAALDDSILGQTFRSQFTGLQEWGINAPALYKGLSGCEARLRKQGTSTAVTGEGMTLVSGKTYKISDATKNMWDRESTVVVYDGITDVTSEVVSYNYLFGTITFDAGYTVLGSVTVDVNYFPTVVVGKATSFTLTQTAEAVDDTDFDSTAANGCYRLVKHGLRTVTLSLDGFYTTSSTYKTQLQDRDIVILEINPDGQGESVARGYFMVTDYSQSGDVGANEQETINFSLYVPSSDFLPFDWSHEAGTRLPTAVRIALDAWINEDYFYARYMPEGVGGEVVSGQVMAGDVSLEGSVDGLLNFTVNMSGNEEPTIS